MQSLPESSPGANNKTDRQETGQLNRKRRRHDLQYKINIMCHTRLTVDNACYGTGNHVRYLALVEPLQKKDEQISSLHS